MDLSLFAARGLGVSDLGVFPEEARRHSILSCHLGAGGRDKFVSSGPGKIIFVWFQDAKCNVII